VILRIYGQINVISIFYVLLSDYESITTNFCNLDRLYVIIWFWEKRWILVIWTVMWFLEFKDKFM